ncbi:MAG: M14 family zinc carboxypeptidase [Nocardioides sp.]
MRRTLIAITPLTLLVPLLGVVGAVDSGAAAPPCESDAPPTYAGEIPTGEDVPSIGFPIGSEETTAAQIEDYLHAVDEASDDVRLGSFGTTEEGRPLTYAIVGSPADVAAAKRASRLLRNPHTKPAAAARIAANSPAIVWMAGNVHGGEESGGDAALFVLHELADRTDCAATTIRDNTVTVIIPTQNPDGREADTRRNTYGFDLNRDWFARTQAETDGKLELMRQYPPVLMSDNHEMGGTDFFFPPNADPIHHEVADRSVEWINELYGGAMQDQFDEDGIPYFNYDIYDLLYMGYGDSVPTTGFLGASMTYEKGSESPIQQRTDEQYLATWTSMFALASDKAAILRGLAANYRQAYWEGVRGKLEPNEVFAPGSTLELEVPDETVRSYFIEVTPTKAAEARALVRRLQRMDVQVRKLTAPLRVPGYKRYAEPRATRVLPRGTFWVSMAQPQKHWIQAMLGEDSYVPFPYFYDVTAWSGPLLYNVPAGRTGAKLRPRSVPVRTLAESAAPRAPRSAVGVWLTDDGTSAFESEGWLRWLLDEKWRVPYRSLTTADLLENALAPLDVLLVPNGDAETAYADLGPDGREALRTWLADGGRIVTWRGGTQLAAMLELTTAELAEPTSDVPGSLIRADVARSPLARGVGSSGWSFYEYDFVMTTNDAASAAVRFPAATSPRWFISGFAEGAEELGRTAAVVDEPYADGRVVAFAGEPNFRAFTDGTQKILWNAIYGADPAGRRVPLRTSADARHQAAVAARSLQSYDGRVVLTLRGARSARVEAALDRAGIDALVERSDGQTRYSFAAPDEDGHNLVRRLTPVLRKVEDTVVALRVP